MDNLDLFKDFLGGDSFSADFMRDTLGVMHEDDAGGMYNDEELGALELADDDDIDTGVDDDCMDDDDVYNATDDDDVDDDTDDGDVAAADDDDVDDDTDDDDLDDDTDDGDVDAAADNDDIDADIDDADLDDDGINDDEILEDGDLDDDDRLSVSEEAINDLLARASDVERPEGGFASHTISFAGVKICATRHGCKGATNCDYSYGAPVRQ